MSFKAAVTNLSRRKLFAASYSITFKGKHSSFLASSFWRDVALSASKQTMNRDFIKLERTRAMVEK
jgi:hypothetical protein